MPKTIILYAIFFCKFIYAQNNKPFHINNEEITLKHQYYDTFCNGQIKSVGFFYENDTSTFELHLKHKVLPDGYALYCRGCTYITSDTRGADSEFLWRKTIEKFEIGFVYTWYENGMKHKSYEVIPDSLGNKYTIFEYSFLEDSTLEKVYRLVLTLRTGYDRKTGVDYSLFLQGTSTLYDYFNKIRRELIYEKGKLYKEDIFHESVKVGSVLYH